GSHGSSVPEQGSPALRPRDSHHREPGGRDLEADRTPDPARRSASSQREVVRDSGFVRRLRWRTMKLTSRYRFSASHRLDTSAMSPEENRKLYGKCNNPHGHGHDYVLDITVDGPVEQEGRVVNRETMNRLVRERVLARLDHKNLNADIPELAGSVT